MSNMSSFLSFYGMYDEKSNFSLILAPESPLESMIPKAKKTNLPIKQLSTANFVASNSNSPRKHSADMVSNRTLATPSPRPMLPSKIPVPGSHQK